MHGLVIDLTGQRFGKLTAIKITGQRGTDMVWLCQCDCGNVKEIRGSDLRRNKTKSCGCLQKETASKRAKLMVGLLHPNWVLDRTKLSNKGRDRSDMAITRACYKRDNFTCQICGYYGNKVVAHHIYSWRDFPDKRFDLDNLVTLCKSCHKNFHSRYGYKNFNADQFYEFKGIYEWEQ